MIADVLVQLDARRAFVVHGAGGIDELSPAGPNLVCEVDDGQRDASARSTRSSSASPAAIRPSCAAATPAENAARIREVFAGGERRHRSAVLLNAAGAIAAGGGARDLREGLELAREALDSGAAAERLEELVAFSQGGGRMRFATPSPRPGSARSRSSSGARPRPATSGPAATSPRSRAPTRRPARARCPCSSTSASAARGTTCAPRALPRRCR